MDSPGLPEVEQSHLCPATEGEGEEHSSLRSSRGQSRRRVALAAGAVLALGVVGCLLLGLVGGASGRPPAAGAVSVEGVLAMAQRPGSSGQASGPAVGADGAEGDDDLDMDMDVQGLLETGKGLVEALQHKDADGNSEVETKKALIATAKILAASCSTLSSHPGCEVLAGIVAFGAGEAEKEDSEELKAIRKLEFELKELKNLNHDILDSVQQQTFRDTLVAAQHLAEDLELNIREDPKTANTFFKRMFRQLRYDYVKVSGPQLLRQTVNSGEDEPRAKAKAALLYQELTAFRLKYGALHVSYAKQVRRRDSSVRLAEMVQERDLAKDLKAVQDLGLDYWIGMDQQSLLKYKSVKPEDISEAEHLVDCVRAGGCGGFLGMGGLNARQAAWNFHCLPRAAKAWAVPKLVPLLQHESREVHCRAIFMLQGVGPAAGEDTVRPLLHELHQLKDGDADGDGLCPFQDLGHPHPKGLGLSMAGLAAEALATLGPVAADKAAPTLARSLQEYCDLQIAIHKSSSVVGIDLDHLQFLESMKNGAAEALGRYGAKAGHAAVRALVCVVEHEDLSDDVRDRAVTALGNVGAAAGAGAMRTLLGALLADTHRSSQIVAIDALIKVAPAPGSEIMRALEDAKESNPPSSTVGMYVDRVLAGIEAARGK